MGISYIPENVWTVCTNQLSPNPQQLIACRGGNLSVRHDNSSVTFLTVDDKNLESNFVCKVPVSIWAALAAIGAGLAIVVSGPIGWAVVGAAACCAVICVATIVTHKCTSPLNEGNWKMEHSTVRINGKIAITRSSILLCSKNGLLTPYFCYSAACAAATSISNNNRKELAANTLAQVITGYFLPGIVGLSAGTLGLSFAGGYVGYSTLLWGEREAIREFDLLGTKDNTHYDNMNQVEENNFNLLPDLLDPQAYIDMGTSNIDLDNSLAISDIIALYKSGQLIVQNTQLARQLNQISGMSRQVLNRNPTAQQILADLNSGKYPDVRSQITNYNDRRFTPSMRVDSQRANSQSIKTNLANIARSSAAIYSLVSPFIATYFSEKARAKMAMQLEADFAASAGINVTANTPID